MRNSHTPGPWRIAQSAGNFDSRVNAYQIKFGMSGNGIAFVEGSGGASLDNKANARLIAAAPDLLAALESVAHELALYLPPDAGDLDASNSLKAARAAIAKATGETP